MKLFGLFAYYREKDIEAAKTLYIEAKSSYELALQSNSVIDYLAFWQILEEKLALLREYSEKIPPETFSKHLTIESKLTEFQWRLRDAIERSELSAISDMRYEYRNN